MFAGGFLSCVLVGDGYSEMREISARRWDGLGTCGRDFVSRHHEPGGRHGASGHGKTRLMCISSIRYHNKCIRRCNVVSRDIPLLIIKTADLSLEFLNYTLSSGQPPPVPPLRMIVPASSKSDHTLLRVSLAVSVVRVSTLLCTTSTGVLSFVRRDGIANPARSALLRGESVDLGKRYVPARGR